ncbi:hypothetical protein GH733_013162 [Mirounga leonina]|nr:hypothetical protein GH733_013162 [Mirounga leonina]
MGHRLFEYILLYKDGVMFQIEQATKQCSKITLTEPWDPLDIPQNATFEDQYSIGGPQEQITETFTKNYSVILSTRFFDIQLGIKDPSVFIPPSTCQAAQPERMSEDCSCHPLLSQSQAGVEPLWSPGPMAVHGVSE